MVLDLLYTDWLEKQRRAARRRAFRFSADNALFKLLRSPLWLLALLSGVGCPHGRIFF